MFLLRYSNSLHLEYYYANGIYVDRPFTSKVVAYGEALKLMPADKMDLSLGNGSLFVSLPFSL
jgi:hypothetical protein